MDRCCVTATVIAAKPRASKAYYRAGLALLALERVDEALDVCAHAGEGAPDDPGFKTLRARAEKKREELRRKEEEKRKMDVAFVVRFSLPLWTTYNSKSPHTVVGHVGWASTGTKPD
jgi:hypothetical protein